jgi:hypothetical protein
MSFGILAPRMRNLCHTLDPYVGLSCGSKIRLRRYLRRITNKCTTYLILNCIWKLHVSMPQCIIIIIIIIIIIRDSQMMMHWDSETCRSYQIQLGIKYVVRLLVICCKYQQNSRYTKFRDVGFVGFTFCVPKVEIFCCTWILLSPCPKRSVVGHGRDCATVFSDITRLHWPTFPNLFNFSQQVQIPPVVLLVCLVTYTLYYEKP